jgi:large subunit ribosomal protein L5
MTRLKEKYTKEVVPALTKEFGYKNVMAVPKIHKVVVNMGLGEATANAKIIETGADELARITGQKPVTRRSKKSIAQFKVRKGQPVGTMVTLRGERMWEFLDRLMSIALPRVRDFKGVSPKGFDGRGNYTLGLRDQLLFPEIDYMKVDKARGMNVSVVTTARTDEEARKLLQFIGVPAELRAGDVGRGLEAAPRSGLKAGPYKEERYGNNRKDRERSQDAEVQGPAAQPLPSVRAPARLHAEVRAVPSVFPQARA